MAVINYVDANEFFMQKRIAALWCISKEFEAGKEIIRKN
jgi:hypothetical protein